MYKVKRIQLFTQNIFLKLRIFIISNTVPNFIYVTQKFSKLPNFIKLKFTYFLSHRYFLPLLMLAEMPRPLIHFSIKVTYETIFHCRDLNIANLRKDLLSFDRIFILCGKKKLFGTNCN